MNRRRSERDEVRITVHKTDPSSIRDDLNNIARQQDSPTLGAQRPMQHTASLEMTPAADQPDAVMQDVLIAFPKLETGVVPNNPFAIGRMKVHRNVTERPAPL